MRMPVKAFSYTAILAETDIRSSDFSVLASSPDADRNDEPLAGLMPTVRFVEDRMVLIAAPRSSSHLKWCSFQVGDVARRVARAGDRLVVSRDPIDRLVLSVFRDERLLVAVGALMNASLGPDVRVNSTGRQYSDIRIEIDIRGHRRVLCERESATIEGYDIYVERTIVRDGWGSGPNESVSIATVDDPVVTNSARRSAVLMADQDIDPLCGERVDGTMIKSRYLIG